MRIDAKRARQLSALVSVVVASQARAIAQTPVLNPANGHYYAKIAAPAGISWSSAKTAAESMSYLGMWGHLATLTNAAENSWVYSTFGGSSPEYWLGAFQDHNSPTYSEPSGGWTWITGEPWTFTAWDSSEPNNCCGGEDYLSHRNAPVWNDGGGPDSGFIIEYESGSGPTGTYCTAGTTSHGCVPSISSNAQPSVSFANSCVISVANVEALKNGLIFYGVDNTGFTSTPWAQGSTSYLCVKHPTQRTPPQNSGGTFNQCDGHLSLDWNAHQAANPLALGNPWVVGDGVYVQAWFRDPPAAKTTNLSNALHLVYVP